MASDETNHSQRISDRLAGHHLLITGSTGFLAKAFVEKLLRSVDTLAGIHLLVRTRSGGASARQRVMREVLGSRAYDRLRASLGEGFDRLCEEKVHVVTGDLTKDRFGLDRDQYSALTRRITLIVNSAATVTFDERIDLAVELNTMGPLRLLKLARDCGGVPFMHVSTSYVCGLRRGTVIEDFSAPECAREKLPRCEKTGGYDLDGLIDSMRGEAAEVRHRFGADTDMCRRELIDAGMNRARFYGWNDTYTFTKWLGEQCLIRDRGDVPLVIFRPAIIEGSYEEPVPGWIDGLRMADPIIVAYGKGKLNEFPTRPELAIDLIPVDFVANAMIATLPAGEGWREGLAVYHCASSERNPFLLKDMKVALERAYRKRPMNDDAGRPIRPGPMRLVDREQFLRKWQRRQRLVTWLQSWCHKLGIRGRKFRRLAAMSRQIEQVIYFAKIYAPYTHLDCRFAVDNLETAAGRLSPEDREAFSFDVSRIDWDDFLVNRHVPGLRAFVLGAGGEPTPRILAAQAWDSGGLPAATDALCGGHLFDVFRRAATRFGGKPFVQVRRNGRWVRYSYAEALHATGAIMQRFLDRGLQPGDAVAICGESSPEWGLTYLSAMRAGLTVVPLDPQLPAADAWASADFAEAKLMCASAATAPALQQGRPEGAPDVVVMGEPFIPKPGATRDTAPEPVDLDGGEVASILFTSGTTVSPKAVQLTHRNLIANATSLVKVHAVDTTDQILSVLPMYHAFEFTGGFMVPMVCGATITYVDELKGPQMLAAMQATGTTIMLVVPRLLRMFNDSIENGVATGGLLKRGLFRVLRITSAATGHRFARRLFGVVHRRFGGRLRMFVCGGSRLDPELFDAFARLGFEVYEGYGLTETSPVLNVNPRGRAKRGSVGPALPGVQVDIRNQNLEGIGEVWVKGANVMSGYLKNEAATAEILFDGWLRTGDLGRVDSEGFLHLTGRSKDLIITGAGKNVYPDEVEARYRELPFVRELCVFGMPSEDGLGDVVHAVIVMDDSGAPELDRSSLEREIRLAAASIGEGVPSHQRIATLHFWTRELPKTSTLKAKRGMIRDLVLAEHRSVVSTDSTSVPAPDETVESGVMSEADEFRLAVIRRIVARQTHRAEEAIRPEMHLHLDLGIDSIGKIDVIGSIETMYAFQIDGDVAARIARVSDLVRVVGDRAPKVDASRVAPVRPKRLAIQPTSTQANGKIKAPLVPMRWLLRGGISTFMNTYVRIRARGVSHVPSSGAFILAPNHSSHLDTPSVVTAVGGRRRVWVAGAEDYFFNTRLKRLVFGKLLDTIPFDRQADGVQGLRRCAEALASGDGLLIFPEGTRSVTGDMQPFKIGVAVLAIERGVPIVPVHIDGAFDLFPKGQRMVRPGTLTVTFGEPIVPPVLDDDADRYQAFRALAQRVEHAVRGLADGARA